MDKNFETILRDEEAKKDILTLKEGENEVLLSISQKRKGKWRTIKTTLTFTQARSLGDSLLYLGKRK